MTVPANQPFLASLGSLPLERRLAIFAFIVNRWCLDCGDEQDQCVCAHGATGNEVRTADDAAEQILTPLTALSANARLAAFDEIADLWCLDCGNVYEQCSCEHAINWAEVRANSVAEERILSLTGPTIIRPRPESFEWQWRVAHPEECAYLPMRLHDHLIYLGAIHQDNGAHCAVATLDGTPAFMFHPSEFEIVPEGEITDEDHRALNLWTSRFTTQDGPFPTCAMVRFKSDVLGVDAAEVQDGCFLYLGHSPRDPATIFLADSSGQIHSLNNPEDFEIVPREDL